MDWLKPKDETRYDVAITFQTERNDVNGLMPRREYLRMLKLMRRGVERATFEMILDGHVSELTFPLQEVDTILALPEIKDNGDNSGGDTSD